MGARRGLSSTRGRELTAVAVLCAAAAVLRLAGLEQSLFGDELFTYHDVRGHGLGGTLDMVAHSGENTPPLFFVLAHAGARVWDATAGIRLPSLVLSVATIPLLYLLGRRVAGGPAGVLAAALLALGPFDVFYGTEARAYATLIFLVVLSTLLLLEAMDRGTWPWWAAFGVCVAAVAYTHYTGIFVLGVQALWAFLASPRGARWRVVAACVWALALFAPWIPYAKGRSLDTFDQLFPLTPGFIGTSVLRALAGHPFVSLERVPGLPWLIVFLAVIALALVTAAAGAWSRRDAIGLSTLRSPAALVAMLAVATPAALLAYSVVAHHLFISRNLSASLPYALVVVAWLVVTLPARARELAAAALVAVTLIGGVQVTSAANQRPPYREAAEFVNARARPGDALIDFSFLPESNALNPLDVYLRPGLGRFLAGSQTSRAWAPAARGARVFLVVPQVGPFQIRGPAPPSFGPAGPCRLRPAAATGAVAGTASACYPLLSSHSYRGLTPIVVVEYGDRPAPGGAGGPNARRSPPAR